MKKIIAVGLLSIVFLFPSITKAATIDESSYRETLIQLITVLQELLASMVAEQESSVATSTTKVVSEVAPTYGSAIITPMDLTVETSLEDTDISGNPTEMGGKFVRVTIKGDWDRASFNMKDKSGYELATHGMNPPDDETYFKSIGVPYLRGHYFDIGELPKGTYTYTVSSKKGDVVEDTSGSVVVK